MGASVLSESGDMQGNGLKGIIAGIILVVLCFIVGAQAAESAMSSAAIIVSVVGALVLIISGKRCWWLIFLLGPVVDALPLPGPMRVIPGCNYVGVVVLGYWLLMWGMGYVKIRWRSLLLLDLLVLALALYLVAAYIRRPVSINFMGIDTDTYGGADYVRFTIAILYYLALSCIPMEKEALTKVLRWSVGIVIIAGFIQFGEYLVRHGVQLSDLESERFIGGSVLGIQGVTAICAKYSLLAIVMNPMLIAAVVMFLGCIVVCGSREAIGVLFFAILNVAIIKREMLSYGMLGVCALFGLYAMSAAGMLERTPHSAQRMASVLPGIKISREAAYDTDGTWQWRMTIWERAFDKRSGWIRDYMFGDGYGLSISTHKRLIRAKMRGQMAGSQVESFAIQGMWHNGVITYIHRLGYVGLSLVSLVLIVGSIYMFCVCIALRGSPLFFPIVFYVSIYATLIPRLLLGANGASEFINEFASLALIKLAYCILREEGKLIPIWDKRRYVPQMIREYGERLNN